jgi:phospholipid N-methyltransferase
VVDRIIAAVDPKSRETVIEIGPGRGALTAKLVARLVASWQSSLTASWSRNYVNNSQTQRFS